MVSKGIAILHFEIFSVIIYIFSYVHIYAPTNQTFKKHYSLFATKYYLFSVSVGSSTRKTGQLSSLFIISYPETLAFTTKERKTNECLDVSHFLKMILLIVHHMLFIFYNINLSITITIVTMSISYGSIIAGQF